VAKDHANVKASESLQTMVHLVRSGGQADYLIRQWQRTVVNSATLVLTISTFTEGQSAVSRCNMFVQHTKNI